MGFDDCADCRGLGVGLELFDLSDESDHVEQLIDAVAGEDATKAARVVAFGRWAGVVNLGSTFFVLYLYTKLFDWFWDWMPKYLFFLLLGLVAVLLLVVMRRFRARTGETAA